MSEDRKYNQRGYMGEDEPSRPSPPPAGGGRRARVVTEFKEAIRCSQCGADLTTLFEVDIDTACPKCKASLHTCRNCYHFDTSARWECVVAIPERIPQKNSGNDCTFFKIRTVSVKDVGGRSPQSANEAMKALENLFKK